MPSFLAQSAQEIRRNLMGKEWRHRRRLPYLKLREIEIFKDLFRSLQPENILEWGAGFSSLYFPGLLDFPFRWLAIEHDEAWYAQLAPMNQNPRMEIRLVRPNHFPCSDACGDGSYEDFRDYIEAAGSDKRFDFIIVDGRARQACLRQAGKILKEGGVILLHDANRRRYHPYFREFAHQALFLDYRRSSGGIWLGSPSRNLPALMDLEKHQRRWSRVRNRAAKILAL